MVPFLVDSSNFRVHLPFCSLLLLILSLKDATEAFAPYKNGSLLIRLSQSPSSFTLPRHKVAMCSPSQKDDEEYAVEVSYEGRSCNVWVRPYETLLAAMERTQAADRLSVPALPSDCRRGNCLTCSGRHANGSVQASLSQGDDGLSPHMSQRVKDAGYFLTCSSFVVGDGLKVELGENDRVWHQMYQSRIEDYSALWPVRARGIRRSNERNVPKWKRKTEEVLKESE